MVSLQFVTKNALIQSNFRFHAKIPKLEIPNPKIPKVPKYLKSKIPKAKMPNVPKSSTPKYPSPKYPIPKYPQPKYLKSKKPKAKIPNVPKYPRLKQRYQLNNEKRLRVFWIFLNPAVDSHTLSRMQEKLKKL